MVTKNWVNIGSGNGLLPDGTKPLPEPVLTNHHWGLVALLPNGNFTLNAYHIWPWYEFESTCTDLRLQPHLWGTNELISLGHFSAEITLNRWPIGCSSYGVSFVNSESSEDHNFQVVALCVISCNIYGCNSSLVYFNTFLTQFSCTWSRFIGLWMHQQCKVL